MTDRRILLRETTFVPRASFNLEPTILPVQRRKIRFVRRSLARVAVAPERRILLYTKGITRPCARDLPSLPHENGTCFVFRRSTLSDPPICIVEWQHFSDRPLALLSLWLPVEHRISPDAFRKSFTLALRSTRPRRVSVVRP